MNTLVPYQDLSLHHAPLQAEFKRAIGEVMDSCAFAGGPFVEKFENEFAAFCGCQDAIGVGSGTEAIWLVLQALGVGPGDEVITVPMTFIATAEAISMTGATPVFVDIDERTYNMDPQALEAAVTSRTKAIIPVHLFGQIADMDRILSFAKSHKLYVIEDAAQAHGARYKGHPAGSMSDAGCFSFYPGKNLGAFGDAGAVVTNNPELAEKVRMVRDHGQLRKHHHVTFGWNGRMDGMQAAVLSVKLQHLEEYNSKRISLAAVYDRLLVGIEGVVRPSRSRDCDHVYHVYAVQVEERRRVIEVFKRRGIGHAIHYPIPVHLQEVYEYLGYRAGDFPVAELCGNQFLSLPMFPELTSGQAALVANALQESLITRGDEMFQFPFDTTAVGDLTDEEMGIQVS